LRGDKFEDSVRCNDCESVLGLDIPFQDLRLG
jgi:hypothetical protein